MKEREYKVHKQAILNHPRQGIYLSLCHISLSIIGQLVQESEERVSIQRDNERKWTYWGIRLASQQQKHSFCMRLLFLCFKKLPIREQWWMNIFSVVGCSGRNGRWQMHVTRREGLKRRLQSALTTLLYNSNKINATHCIQTKSAIILEGWFKAIVHTRNLPIWMIESPSLCNVAPRVFKGKMYAPSCAKFGSLSKTIPPICQIPKMTSIGAFGQLCVGT